MCHRRHGGDGEGEREEAEIHAAMLEAQTLSEREARGFRGNFIGS
jgi:hypothetical protein